MLSVSLLLSLLLLSPGAAALPLPIPTPSPGRQPAAAAFRSGISATADGKGMFQTPGELERNLPRSWCVPKESLSTSYAAFAAPLRSRYLWLYDCRGGESPDCGDRGDSLCTLVQLHRRKSATAQRAVERKAANEAAVAEDDAVRHSRSPSALRNYVSAQMDPLYRAVTENPGAQLLNSVSNLNSAGIALELDMPGVRETEWQSEEQREEAIAWVKRLALDLNIRFALSTVANFDRYVVEGRNVERQADRSATVHTRAGVREGQDDASCGGVTEGGMCLPAREGDDVLHNFSYQHRASSALSEGMFKNDITYRQYAQFASRLGVDGLYSPDVGSKAEASKHIKEYFAQADPPRATPRKELFKLMEGNPYAAAYALHYESAHEEQSSSPGFPFSWSSQPLEIDMYLPPDIAEKAARHLENGRGQFSLTFDEIVANEIRVGHAGLVGMGLELRKGCGVTTSSLTGVGEFMNLGSWFRTFNVALEYLQGDIRLNTVSPSYIANSDPRPKALQRLFRNDMRIVCDFKCHFDTVVLDAIVESINRQFGVVVDAVGSFYALPELKVPQYSSYNHENREATLPPPRVLTFFFAPAEAKKGLDEGRIHRGGNVLVTAAALIQVERDEVDKSKMSLRRRLWEALPLTSKTLGQCKGYKIDEAALATLRSLKEEHDIKLGLWTLEAELGREALEALIPLANDVDLFPLGFALGGEHAASAWASDCEAGGGTRSLGIASSFMKNVKARATKSWGLFD